MFFFPFLGADSWATTAFAAFGVEAAFLSGFSIFFVSLEVIRVIFVPDSFAVFLLFPAKIVFSNFKSLLVGRLSSPTILYWHGVVKRATIMTL